MKLINFIAFLLLMTICSKAQHNHFIYIQSENKQPFYVRIGDQLYSSATAGYLIIPKLQPGLHSLSVGFPKNKWPQQSINVEISGIDQGYILKQFNGNDWGLFNIQTMNVVMAGRSKMPVTENASPKSDDFSNTLADVVNTPSIKQTKEEGKNEVTLPSPSNNKTEMASPRDTTNLVSLPTSATNQSNNASSKSIKRIEVLQLAERYIYKYQLVSDLHVDTIDVEIQLKTSINEIQPSQINPGNEKVIVGHITTDQTPKNDQQKTGEPKFIDLDLPESGLSNTKSDKVPTPAQINNQTPMGFPNSDCKNLATENDFLKARKKMSAQKTEEHMVEVAKKLFKQQCFNTEQVKNLSVLFLSDEGKYKFFDAAYPFVYDSDKFSELAEQLKDEYYISRFNTMIRK